MSLLQCSAKNRCQRHQEESHAQSGNSPHHVKLSHHWSIIAAALSSFLFLVLSVVSAHLSFPLLPFVASHLCTLVCACVVFFLHFPFPLSPLLFLLFTAQGEILVSTIPPLHLHLSLPLWVGGGVNGHSGPCRETGFVLLDGEEGSERVTLKDISWGVDTL